MRGSRSSVLALLVLVAGAGWVSLATAAVVPDGDVDPFDPTTWTTDTYAYVGKTGTGNVLIDGGDTIESNWGVLGRDPTAKGSVEISGTGSVWETNYLRVGDQGSGSLVVSGGARLTDNWSYLGDDAGSTGEVTIDGAGTRWFNIIGINVGNAGDGTLNIINGGWVRAWSNTYVARKPGSAGRINFGPGGGTLETGCLLASPGQLGGVGTVECRGLVSDVDLVFDTAASLSQTLVFDSLPGQNVTVSLDMATDPSRNESLGAGWKGDGSLTIADGVTVESHGECYLGYHAGSRGTATISGTDSAWAVNGWVYVGHDGRGSLAIADGGSFSSSVCYLGYRAGATGEMTVDGASSAWTTPAHITVGHEGRGSLAITGGAVVNSDIGYLGLRTGSQGEATVSGSGSTWNIDNSLYVGASGEGRLTIADGGSAVVKSNTYVASYDGSDGMIAFGTGGGTLATRSLYTSPAQWTGTGTVATRGLVSDVDLVFDSAASLTQTLKFDHEPGQNVTVMLDMSDPGTAGDLGAGYADSSSLVIRDGTTVESRSGCLGYKASSIGTATVNGTGSTWVSGYSLYVGDEGTGLLSIMDGGTVSSHAAYVGHRAGSSGRVWVDGGATWTCSDVQIGSAGRGSLVISGGGVVDSGWSHISYSTGSVGEVLVSGPGSTWITGPVLEIGNSGRASMVVADGGRIDSQLSALESYDSDVSTDVLVTGPGTTWTNSLGLSAGGLGGILALSDGALVTARSCSVGGGWLLAVEVSGDTRLEVDGGENLYNGSTVRIIAGARPMAGAVFTPLVADVWTGSGVYQAVGGTWDAAAHTFTASAVEMAGSGVPVAVDLAEVQRVRVEDAGSGWTVGASFLKTESPTTLGLTATAIDGAMLAELEALAGGQDVLGAWEFAATTGYAEGDPAYLSFVVGNSLRENVTVWHHDGTGWSEYDACDLTCDGFYASFTVEGLSGYAVSAVPEPGTLGLLAALAGVLLLRRR